MSCADHAIRALILHDWKDATEWASALAALSEVTDGQLDDRLHRAIVSYSQPVHGSHGPTKAKGQSSG
jgi:hypothetical protein